MRANHIDVARALCIMLVVFGHSELARHFGAVNTFLTSFRMPLFFMIAGSFFSPREPLAETVRRKGDGLLKPYLTLAMFYAPFYLVGHAQQTWAGYALDVLTFSGHTMPGRLLPMWFLTLLWALHIGGRMFVQLTGFDRAERSRQVCWLLMLLMCGYGLLQLMGESSGHPDDLASAPGGLPFNLQLWPLAAFFFFTGHLLSREIRTWSFGASTTGVAAMVFAASHLLYHPSIDLLSNHYADLMVTTVAALSGSLAVIGLSHALARVAPVREAIAPLGRLSLYVLMFHAPVLSFSEQAIRALLPAPDPLWTALASMLATLLITFTLGRLIQRVPAMRLLFEPRHRVLPASGGKAAREEARAASAPPLQPDAAIRLPS